MTGLAQQARAIFTDALREVDVNTVMAQHIQCDGITLKLGSAVVTIEELDKIIIVAVGKASSPMHRAAIKALQLSALPPLHSIVVAPELPSHPIANTRYLIGSHPTPDECSLLAAGAILALLKTATADTAVLFLISGGASAMIEHPLDPRISIADTAAFHRALVASGLPIAQMNALRKHFSAVKGGRLAQTASVARLQHTLLISDVPAATPDTIGSGPSLPDSTTLADCESLISKLQSACALPASVPGFFASALCVETPKPSDKIFERSTWSVILSSDNLAQSASSAAREAGFHVEIDNTCDEWEYRDAARYLLDRSHALAQQHPKSCLISVGEVSVALPANSGHGGRNQQFALYCATELTRRGYSMTVLSAGSDGIDGNSRAAGAICDEKTVDRAAQIGLSADVFLARFDSATLLAAIGAEITTGPTGNNLRDLRLLLAATP